MLAGCRFGVSMHGASSVGEWVELAQRVEAGGFDMLVMPERLTPSVLSPLPALAVAAAATTTLRFGTMLANNDLRLPVTLAHEAATMDLVTGGRFELGLGADDVRGDDERSGIATTRPSERVARLSESIDVLRLLWDGPPAWYDGVHYQLRGQRCDISGRASAIRIVVGGSGWRVLDLAARKADTVSFVGADDRGGTDRTDPELFTDHGLAQQCEWVREAAGDRFDQLELALVVRHVAIAPRRRRAAELIRAQLPQFSAGELLDSPYILIGSTTHIADRLCELRDRFRITYFTVPGTSWQATEEVLRAL